MLNFTEKEKEFFNKRDELLKGFIKSNEYFSEQFITENQYKITESISLNEGDTEYNLIIYSGKENLIAINEVYIEREGGMTQTTYYIKPL